MIFMIIIMMSVGSVSMIIVTINMIIKMMMTTTARSINKTSKNDIEGEREQALVDQWVGFSSLSSLYSLSSFSLLL